MSDITLIHCTKCNDYVEVTTVQIPNKRENPFYEGTEVTFNTPSAICTHCGSTLDHAPYIEQEFNEFYKACYATVKAGWICTDGVVHNCEPDKQAELAGTLCRFYDIEPEATATDTLLDRGFIRIENRDNTSAPAMTYRTNQTRTDEQIKVMLLFADRKVD